MYPNKFTQVRVASTALTPHCFGQQYTGISQIIPSVNHMIHFRKYTSYSQDVIRFPSMDKHCSKEEY